MQRKYHNTVITQGCFTIKSNKYRQNVRGLRGKFFSKNRRTIIYVISFNTLECVLWRGDKYCRKSPIKQLISFNSKLLKGALLNLQIEIKCFVLLYLFGGFYDYGG